MRMLNQNVAPASLLTELPLKLARKCVEVLGTSSFDEEGVSSHTVNTGMEEEVSFVCAGKEFGLIRTCSGKVFDSMHYFGTICSVCPFRYCIAVKLHLLD